MNLYFTKYHKPAIYLATLCMVMVIMAGCDAMQQNGARAGAGVNNAFNDTRYKVSRYIYGEKPQQQVQYVVPPAATFCYQAQLDIMCFDRPKPEMHLNLIAVHGEHNYAYEDFLPNNIRAQEAAFRAVSGQNYSNNYANDVNHNDVNYSGINSNGGNANDIMMSNLPINGSSSGGAGSVSTLNSNNTGGNNMNGVNSPFYYSPSPATRDPFGDSDKIRSKYIP